MPTNSNLRRYEKMNFEQIEKNNIMCVSIIGDKIVITDSQSALDLLMSAKYDMGTKNIVIDKKLIVEDFFTLSTGLAGEILQKYVNYGGRIAIYGDFSHYTSKPLKDFIYENPHLHSVATNSSYFVLDKLHLLQILELFSLQI